MPKITLQTEIKAPKVVVFNLSRSVDLHLKSTAHTGEKAIAGKTSGMMELGEQVTWRARHFGVWQTLTSRITEMESPNMFVDEMVNGAFKSFRHLHQFEEVDSITKMTDTFDFQSPFGVLGKLADFLFLIKYMTKFLLQRNLVIKEFAESDKWKSLLLHRLNKIDYLNPVFGSDLRFPYPN